jgi:hypothetical protein
MSRKAKKSLWKKLLIIITSFIGGLIALTYIFLNYWEPVIKSSIKDSFYKSTNKLYRIDFEDIGFNVFMGNISLKNITLTPDQQVYVGLKKNKKQPAYLFELSIERAKVRGIHLLSFYKSNALEIDDISVNNPQVKVINDLSYKKELDDTSLFRNPYDLIKHQFKHLKIDQINLKNIHFEFISDSVGKKKSKKIYLSFFKVRNLFIDSLSQKDTSKPFYSDDIKISMKNFTHPFRDSVNLMHIEEVVVSTATSSIQVYNFKVIPKLDEDTYKDVLGFKKTRIELYIKETYLQKVNFKKLFFEQKLYGDKVDIQKLESNIFRNNLIPINPNKKVRFPTELVYDIRIPFHFDKVNFVNSKVRYSERDLKTKYRWNITFENINGQIENFSNDTVALNKNQHAKISLTTSFNGKAKSSAEIVLDYLHPLKPFYVKGLITNYNLRDVSPILAELVHMEISNCNLRALKFVMNGDKKSMNSNISMMYNNLRVKILEVDDENKKLKKHGFLTILANHMVLEDANPRSSGKLVKSKFVMYKKEPWSFFSFIWKGILKGMKESVGLNEQMEKELRFQADRYYDFKNFTKELKDNRKHRRDERRKKRLEKKAERRKLSLQKDTLFTKTKFN